MESDNSVADQMTGNEGQPQTTVLKNVINIIASPSEAFNDLKIRSPIIAPLLIVLVAQASALVVYFLIVDFAWLVDSMINLALADAPDEAKQTMRRVYTAMGRYGMMGSSVVSVLLMLPLFTALYGGYLTIVSSVANLGIRFGQWFAFLWWCSIPMVFTSLASIVNLLLNDSNGQISQQDISPLTLNNLVFSMERSEPYYGLVSSVNVTDLWVLVLTVIGFKIWSGKDYFTSAALALAPAVVIVGIVVLIAG